MNRSPSTVRAASLGAAACLFAAVVPGGALAAAAQGGAAPELLSALAAVRTAGCPGRPGARTPLRAVPRLDDAARRVAQGVPGIQAVQAVGYRATRLLTVTMTSQSSVRAVAQTMAGHYCKTLTDPKMTDFGFHREGGAYWLLFAVPFSAPSESDAPAIAARVLSLVNEARAQPRRCGGTHFAAAAPVQANAVLDRAAAVHAQDMARHGYLEHAGRDGRGPAERATRAGYRWRTLGENIAAGQTSAEQVVRDWTLSPEHCANLMNPAFTEMGIAFAVNQESPQAIYWTQKFGSRR